MPRKSATEKVNCFISANVNQDKIDEIREKVCQDLDITKHSDGNHYCLLHLPDKDKNLADFQTIIEKRFEDIVSAGAKIESEQPESEWKDEAKTLKYDFSYVYFPSQFSFANKKFLVSVGFSSAKFSGSANFWSANFRGEADFSSVNFSGKADFWSANFRGEADFRSAKFSGKADFRSAKFSGQADFRSANFSDEADFWSANFSGFAFFISAKFSSKAYFVSAKFSRSAVFESAKFSGVTDFFSAKFSGSADFKSANFSRKPDFIWVNFLGEADFKSAKFLGEADFRLANFSGQADFKSAKFSGSAYFISANFSRSTDFSSAKFSDSADFSSANFSGSAYFSSAKVEETSQLFFNQTCFIKNVDFRLAIIKGYLLFEAGEGEFFEGEWLDEEKTKPKKVKRLTSVFEKSLDFALAKVENPERITFNKVRLRPNWFVNIDSRKFIFTDIAWENHKAKKSELKEELESLEEREFQEPHNYQLLTVAFRNLAANAEEFNRFEEASNFRKSASECELLERKYRQRKWRNDLREHWGKNILCRSFFVETKKTLTESWKLLRKTPVDFVHSLYRWLSGYGENWFRAFCWLFVIWFVSAIFYTNFGTFGTEEKQTPIMFLKSLGYSLQVMALQKPEPRPYDWLTYLYYGIETIFAPIQATLLALAIRRKFIR